MTAATASSSTGPYPARSASHGAGRAGGPAEGGQQLGQVQPADQHTGARYGRIQRA